MLESANDDYPEDLSTVRSWCPTRVARFLSNLTAGRANPWDPAKGTSAACLYDLLKPHVAKVIVCDPRKNALLTAGNKNDRVDARKLSHLLRAGLYASHHHFR